MKRLTISTVALFLFFLVRSQNVGIGITTPRAKLHVFQGASGSPAPFSPMVVEDDANTYVNLLSPNEFETGILFGNATHAARGGIVYNNASTLEGLQFRTAGNQTRMVITSNGFVGIGTTNPGAPLAFPSSQGKKITLYPGAGGTSGFSITDTRVQIYTHDINGTITFGYDLLGTLHETFGIRANGALVVNGTSGSVGQVLQSNGTAAPVWTTPANPLYNNTIMLQSSSAILLNTNSTVDLPGLSHTFTANSNTKVLINFAISATPPSCFACGLTEVVTYIYLDGGFAKSYRHTLENNSEDTIAGTFLITVGAGSHTITFKAIRSGPDVWLGHSGMPSVATLQIIPQ